MYVIGPLKFDVVLSRSSPYGPNTRNSFFEGLFSTKSEGQIGYIYSNAIVTSIFTYFFSLDINSILGRNYE